MAATVLVTGFGPFGDVSENPSASLVQRLDGQHVGGATVAGVVFDVATARVSEQLERAIIDHNPAMLIGTGVAAGRAALALERVAINVRDFAIADCDGEQPRDLPVLAGGDDGVFATLPLRAMLEACGRVAVPAYLSNTAGAYLCNQLFYLSVLAGRRGGFPAGFVHLPLTPETAAGGDRPPQPTMELQTMERGLKAAIDAALSCSS